MRNPPGPSRWPCFALAYLIVSAGCAPGEIKTVEEATEPQLDTIEVELITLDRKPWPTVLRSQGSLVADEQTTVGSKVAGRVAEVHIDFGDSVAVGDPLVTLELQDFQLQVVQAEAQLQQARSAVGLAEGDLASELDPENSPPVRLEKALWTEAKSSLERSQRLLQQNAVSQGEYELALAAERAAEARHASALNSVREKIAVIGTREAELALAKQQLADATICSPINGYVRNRQVAAGTFVTVGEPIATIVRTDPLRFRGTVPERYAQALAVGPEVTLKVVSVDDPCETRITRVSPALDALSRSLAFEAEVPNPDQQLRSGIFAEAEIVVDTRAEALVIPHSALTEFAGVEKVWKVVDGVATEQEVLVGPRREQGREILRGLDRGDQILLHADQGRVARVSPAGGTSTPAVRSAAASPEDALPSTEQETLNRPSEVAGDS